ncbi:hypothetical protein B9G55_18440 [Saccharibacillus sp. O16]|nr:hypothetical protein B9G55_18440 [Saccharibacillus sp. O16]
MTKMKSLSALAVTLMLAGVLAACGSDKAASPAATNNAEEAIENIPAAADNDAHPTDETDIDMAEEEQEEAPAEAPADNSSSTPAPSESTDSSTSSTETSSPSSSSSSTETDKDKSESAPAESSTKTDSSDSAKTDESKAPATAAAAEQTGEGSYSGLADSHSAEIDVNGKAMTYQLSEQAQQQINQIPNDAKVTFTYTEEKVDDTTTVMTITDIKAAK